MIKLGPIHNSDGAFVRALGNVARGFLVLFCLVAWMPPQARAIQPAPPKQLSASATANPGELDITWSWDNTDNSHNCPIRAYQILYKKTTVSDWDDFLNFITSANPNNADRGLIELHDITNGATEVSSKMRTIGLGLSGHNPGEIAVALDPVSYNIGVRVYSEADDCSDFDNSNLDNYSTIAEADENPTPMAASTPSFGSETISNQSWRQNSAITSLTLPAATGGNGTLTYTLSPALPTGVTLEGSTLSGTPTGTLANTTYTYKVTDADNNTAASDEAKLTFTITVEADTAPSFGSNTISDQVWTEDLVITSLTLPEATGGNGTLTYSISPALPAGLSFNTTTRVLSGTPDATQGETTYTYRVSDRNNNTVTLTFTITVIAEKCSVSNVKDEDEDSLRRFVECAAQRIADSDTFWDTLELLESFREDGGNWRDGSTHLVLLTSGGGVYFHAEDREEEDLDWSGAVSCEGGESVLKSKQGCFIEYEGKKNGYAHRFTASQIPLVQGSGEFVLLGGSYGSPEGEAFSGEIDGPMTKASDVDRDEDLTEFVEEAGRAVKEGIEDSDIDPAELRGILRGEGEWREGEVSVFILEENGRVIFHGGDREREQKDEYVKYKDIIEYTGAVVVEYMEESELMRGYAEKVEISAGGSDSSDVYLVGSGYRVDSGSGAGGGGGCGIGGIGKGVSVFSLGALVLFAIVLLRRRRSAQCRMR